MNDQRLPTLCDQARTIVFAPAVSGVCSARGRGDYSNYCPRGVVYIERASAGGGHACEVDPCRETVFRLRHAPDTNVTPKFRSGTREIFFAAARLCPTWAARSGAPLHRADIRRDGCEPFSASPTKYSCDATRTACRQAHGPIRASMTRPRLVRGSSVTNNCI